VFVLVGLPGSGKSTVGRHLARKLNLPFIDSDHAIEQRLGCSIREFFEVEGEERFRDIESEVVDQLTQGADGVLSTGGGTVIRPLNRERLRARGVVFYLRTSPEDVFRRLRHDQSRPLLQVADPLVRLRELFEVRDPLYTQTAHHVIEGTRPHVGALLQLILKKLELHHAHLLPNQSSMSDLGPTQAQISSPAQTPPNANQNSNVKNNNNNNDNSHLNAKLRSPSSH
jgi:shikimate kinase